MNPSGLGYAVVYVDDVSLTGTTTIADGSTPAVRVGPVPFSDELLITMPSRIPSDLFLYDLSARLVLRERFIGSTRLSTSSLPCGTYIYVVQDEDGGTERGRVVKE